MHPLQGRIAGCRAELIAKRIDWDAGAVAVDVVVRQAMVFGENLELHRRYAFALGRGEVMLHDVVTNRGFRPSRHGILYHVNVGHPILAETAQLHGPGWSLADRLRGGATPVDDHVEVVGAAPSPPDGCVGLTVGGVALRLRFDAAALPITALWRAFQSRTYALGLEPQTDLADPDASALAACAARSDVLSVMIEDAPADPHP